MTDPWLPPSLGASWEQLLQALLHDPSLGGEGKKHPYQTHVVQMLSGRPPATSDPMPADSTHGVVSFIISALSFREIALAMPEGPAQTRLLQWSEATINRLIDDICGTPPHPLPFPGPPPWIYPLALQLTLAAHNFQEGELRQQLLSVAGRIIQHASNLVLSE